MFLSYIVCDWSCRSTIDHKLQRGCLEAFHLLAHHYPPPSMPDMWGCLEKPCSILNVLLQLLTSSRIVWGIQGKFSPLHLFVSACNNWWWWRGGGWFLSSYNNKCFSVNKPYVANVDQNALRVIPKFPERACPRFL